MSAKIASSMTYLLKVMYTPINILSHERCIEGRTFITNRPLNSLLFMQNFLQNHEFYHNNICRGIIKINHVRFDNLLLL